MEIYSPAISSAAAEYISTLNSKVTGGDEGLRQGLAPAADESRRARSGHRRHREGPQRSDRRSNGRRRATASCSNATSPKACAPSRATCCSALPIIRWCGRSSTSPSAISAAWPSGQRAIVRARSFPGPEFSRKGQRDLSAAQQGDAHGARAHRTAQSGSGLLSTTCMSMPRSTPAVRTPVLAVPESAVIDSGSRQVVIVDKGEGPVRAARGQARPSRRRLRRDPRRRRRGRAGRRHRPTS